MYSILIVHSLNPFVLLRDDNNRSLDELPVNMISELDRAGDRLTSKTSKLIDEQITHISEC